MKTAPFCFHYNKEIFPNYFVAFRSLPPFDVLLFHGLIQCQHSKYLQNNNQRTNIDFALIWCELDKE